MAIKGLDQFQRRMKELERTLSMIDGEIGSVSFDPHDPQSIELAIQKMEAVIDERVGGDTNNDLVEGILESLKETCREAILERAAEARGEAEDDN